MLTAVCAGALGTPVFGGAAGSSMSSFDPTPYRPFDATSAATAPTLHILVIGTGLDNQVLPPGIKTNIVDPAQNTTDWSGTTTSDVSAMTTIYPQNQLVVDSYAVEVPWGPYSAHNLGWGGALQYAHDNASKYDAVLLDYDPSFSTDQSSNILNGNEGVGTADVNRVSHELAENPVYPAPIGNSGTYNVENPNWGPLASVDPARTRDWAPALSNGDRMLNKYLLTARNDVWIGALQYIQQIADLGLPVIAAAGDSGKSGLWQSITGIPGTSSVITVGAAAGDGNTSDADGGWTTTPSSATGPARDGSIKPDLLVPGDATVVVSKQSSLYHAACDGTATSAVQWLCGGVVDTVLGPFTANPVVASTITPATDQASSNVAAAIATVEIAQIRHRWPGGWPVGANMTGVLRSLLQARSRRLTGAGSNGVMPPAFAQGAGVLTGALQPADVTDYALPTVALNLPLTNASSASGSPLNVSTYDAGSRPLSVNATTYDQLGADLDGMQVESRWSGPQPVAATESSSVISLWDALAVPYAGADCGWATIVSTVAQAMYPYCALRSLDISLRAYYPANRPVGYDTFTLDVSNPVTGMAGDPFAVAGYNGGSAPDPFDWPMYWGTTGADGTTVLHNVLPGWYELKLWGDFSVESTVGQTSGGQVTYPVRELGHPIDYQNVYLVVGSPLACPSKDPTPQDWTTWPACTPTQSQWDAGHPGAVDDANQLCQESTPAGTIDFLCGPVNFRVGPSVASHRVKNLSCGDFSTSLQSLAPSQSIDLTQLSVVDTAGQTACGSNVSGWHWGETSGPDPTADVAATYQPTAAPGVQPTTIGVAHYVFSLPSPNYTAHMVVNLNYMVSNAVVALVGMVRGQPRTSVIADSAPSGSGGVTYTSQGSPSWNNYSSGFTTGPASGSTTSIWDFIPDHTNTGDLYILVIPTSAQAVRFDLHNIAYSLDTWSTSSFTRASLNPDDPGYNTFYTTFSPNLSQPVNPNFCRTRTVVSQGALSTMGECDEMRMMVSTPLGADPSQDDFVSAVMPGASSEPVAMDVFNPQRPGGAFAQGFSPFSIEHWVGDIPVISTPVHGIVDGRWAGIVSLPTQSVDQALGTGATLRAVYSAPGSPPAVGTAAPVYQGHQFSILPWFPIDGFQMGLSVTNQLPSTTNPTPGGLLRLSTGGNLWSVLLSQQTL